MKDNTSQPLYLATEATYIDCATIIFKQLDDASPSPWVSPADPTSVLHGVATVGIGVRVRGWNAGSFIGLRPETHAAPVSPGHQ